MPENSACVFPFWYKNKLYSKCISDDHDRPWCSTTVDYDRNGLWGDCKSKCVLPQNLNLHFKSISIYL